MLRPQVRAWKGVSEAVARNERQHLERKILVFGSNLSPKCFAHTASWDLWVKPSLVGKGLGYSDVHAHN